jgi:putative transposase
VLHYSVQQDHIHLVVEAADKRALSSGVRGLAIRVALYVNDLLLRRGSFWADRWHGRALKTPREVRSALVYVLANFRKHLLAKRNEAARTPSGIDPCSSAAWFDGFREWTPASGRPPPFAECSASGGSFGVDDMPVAPARSWLARVGWRRHGLVGIDEAPALAAR